MDDSNPTAVNQEAENWELGEGVEEDAQKLDPSSMVKQAHKLMKDLELGYAVFLHFIMKCYNTPRMM